MAQVINADQNETQNYTLSLSVIPNNKPMIDDDQALLTNLYGRCCAPAGSCNAWKALSVRYANATGNPIRTDFCSFPGQICTPSGLSAAQSGDDRHLPHSVVLDTGSTLLKSLFIRACLLLCRERCRCVSAVSPARLPDHRTPETLMDSPDAWQGCAALHLMSLV